LCGKSNRIQPSKAAQPEAARGAALEPNERVTLNPVMVACDLGKAVRAAGRTLRQ